MMHPIRRIAILVGFACAAAVVASVIVGALIRALTFALVAVQP